MAGLGKYKKGAKFTLKSGNNPAFKMIAGDSPITNEFGVGKGTSPYKHEGFGEHTHAHGGSGSYRKDPDDDNKLKQTGVGGEIDKDDYKKGNKFDSKENQKEAERLNLV